MKMVQVMKTVSCLVAVLCLSQISDCCNLGKEEMACQDGTRKNCCNLGKEEMACQDGTRKTIQLKNHIGCQERRSDLCKTVEPDQKHIAFDNCSHSRQAICDTKEGEHRYRCIESKPYKQAVTACQKLGGNLADVCPGDIISPKHYCNTSEINFWVNNSTTVENGTNDLKVCGMSVLLMILLDMYYLSNWC